MSLPYDYAEARAAIERASVAQRDSEIAIRDTTRTYAAAERAYRMALAQEILKLKAEGVAVTVAQDLAKGAKTVADLRFERDVADGVREAARVSTYRHAADRRELEQLVDWSRRVSPDGQYEPLRSVAA